MNRKYLGLFLLFIFLFVLTGCNLDQPIKADGGMWDRFFVYPLAWSLEYIAQTMNPTGEEAHDRYGWAIVILTIVIRFVILPLTIKQRSGSQKMQALKPEIEEIRQKYEDEEVAHEETMKLFERHKVNPAVGCLPLFIQMPIIIALLHAIRRHDMIPGHQFFGVELGEPFWGFALLAGFTTFLQQKIAGSTDHLILQFLLVALPISVTVFAWFFPSALSLYWVVGNLFMMAYTLVTKAYKQEENVMVEAKQ
ncbi:membrane protein insertase YidC [Caldalkalibacillus salinus]|uniref:membrane protein insertase YidC n=1 Tax=Caldalkalibacillus salinus TaxID=2803787 RepID=UPI0019237378|nr:membrane protein insertase YidC [Caldalkalibacillus salinus]